MRRPQASTVGLVSANPAKGVHDAHTRRNGHHACEMPDPHTPRAVDSSIVSPTASSLKTGPKLTAKGQATRQRIIDGAAAEIRTNGALATTLEDVMARTATSKSQLFHYFPAGKDQLLLAVAEQEAERVLSDQQPHLSRLVSWAAWQRWRDVVVERYRRQGQQCPLSTVMSEIGRTPGARAVTSTLITRWRLEIEVGIRAMQEQGKIDADVEPVRAAAALLAGIQGGVSVMLSTGDLSYLEAALDVGIAALRRQ
ncbi:TetR/AcrR family transcriptional regulator [Mycolicibacterium sediminis]|uniref:TetR family transcriptional regulator n=1 Tax=Mycolicibacterium sediminis TaxID=1286180 RepID=A0A7I7QYE5_9MYCO|nr:TetR family transcriptional regulator [Mycolicibacterium sediminis]